MLHLITLSDTQTFDRTPLDEESSHRRGLYLTTHNTHKTETVMPLARFESTISASLQLENNTLSCAPTGIGRHKVPDLKF